MDGTESHHDLLTGLSGSLSLFPDLSNGKIEEYLSHIENVANESQAIDRKMLILDGPTSTLPSVEKYEGPYGFKAAPKDGPPQPFMLYSPALNHVFIKMNNVLMMRFHLNEFPEKMDLFVRALLVYVNDDDRASAVSRCLVHHVEDDPTSQAHVEVGVCQCHFYKHAGHVLRCNSNHSVYCYDATSSRHSIVHPLTRPQPGTQSVLVPFTFTCQSSCTSGMNRRSVQIVFTLEDGEGIVMGRDVLPVKICSCPKRDKERMEKETNGRNPGASKPRPSKRHADSTSAEHVAKVKIECATPPPVRDRDERRFELLKELRTMKEEIMEKLNRMEALIREY